MIKENPRFLAELKKVYFAIDKASSLYWTHRNESELVRESGGRRTLRSKVSDEKKEENKNWEETTDAQFGYGEITLVSAHQLIHLGCYVQTT